MESFQKTKKEISFNPAVPLLGIFAKELNHITTVIHAAWFTAYAKDGNYEYERICLAYPTLSYLKSPIIKFLVKRRQ